MSVRPQMSREDFIAFIMDHIEKPRNNRTMENPTVEVSGGNPGCGDVVTMYLKVDEDEKIEDISFVAEGCMISRAGASFMTSRLKGKKLSEVEEMSYDIITETFGRDVMATRPRCATLALGTTKAAIKKYRDDVRKHLLDEEQQRDTPVDAVASS